MQVYSNPSREDDKFALPDVEVFWMSASEFRGAGPDTWMSDYAEDNPEDMEGYFYWFCFPGCLPDSGPVGPFATEKEAIEDMREQYGDDDEGED